MSKYDFETIPNKHNNDSLSVDGPGVPDGFIPGAPKDGFDVIPMWVADMNFVLFPDIEKAIVERTEAGPFGYFRTRSEYYDAIIRWHKTRHHSVITKEEIGYENGVLGCFASVISVYTNPGDNVLVLNPSYTGFVGTITHLSRNVVRSDLYRDSSGTWRIDYDSLDQTIRENHVKVVTFCSPFNPIGRVWEKDEIEKFISVCKKNGCIVFNDEIWSDFVFGKKEFIPTRDVNEDARNITVTACAPSKTFNLAGLVGSYHIIPNPEIRKKVDDFSLSTHYNSMNVLSQAATIAAYSENGDIWVDELNDVISSNAETLYHYLHDECTGLSMAKPEGTYMLYVDATEYLKKSNMTIDDLLRRGWDVGVTWQNGVRFGMPNTIRINLALPHAQLLEAVRRLKKYVF